MIFETWDGTSHECVCHGASFRIRNDTDARSGERFEVFTERQSLTLVGRTDPRTVHLVRRVRQLVIEQRAHDLILFHEEWYFVRSDLEDRTRPSATAQARTR